MSDLAGRTALVIGGTEGIGRAAATAFAAAGANVFVAGLDASRGRSLESELRSTGRDAAFMEADVTREADLRAVIEAAAARFGRIHVAVNNAGTEGRFAPLHEQTIEEFDRIIAVNLRGVWLGLKYQIAHMLAHGGGAIVN